MRNKPNKKTIDAVCSECGASCICEVKDFGIGSYEYWGASYNDTQYEAVSNCCDSPCFFPETATLITKYDLE